MKLMNYEIYNYALQLSLAFQDKTQRLPSYLNFNIQKNLQTLLTLAKEIEKAKNEIFQHYGQENKEGEISILQEFNQEAIKELNDLFEIVQEVNILTIDIKKYEDTQMSIEQMEAIMFMIEE